MAAIINNAKLREPILIAQKFAVKAVIRFLESKAITRSGKNGKVNEKFQGFIVADYAHLTNRNIEPQIHDHCIILNLAYRYNQKWSCVDSSSLKNWAVTADFIYKSELVYQLRKIGLVILCKEGKIIKIEGIPQVLVDYFSQATKEINTLKSVQNITSSSSNKYTKNLRLFNRPKKNKRFSDEELINKWNTEIATIIPKPIKIERYLNFNQKFKAFVDYDQIISQLSKHKSNFDDKVIYQFIVDEMVKANQSSSLIEKNYKGLINHWQFMLVKKEGKFIKRWTTKINFNEELNLVQKTKQLSEITDLSIHDFTVINNCISVVEQKNNIMFDLEQIEAIYSLLNSPHINTAQGSAGTGKTTQLKAVNQVYKHFNYNSLGACIKTNAATNLQNETEINSTTIASILVKIQKDLKPLKNIQILIIDEAGQVPLNTLVILMNEVLISGVKLILIGEDKQINAIEKPGALRYLSLPQIIGTTRVENIKRQKNDWDKQAVVDFRDANANNALIEYHKHNQLIFSKNQDSSINRLVTQYIKDYQVNPKKEQLVIAQSWKIINIINNKIQQHLLAISNQINTGISLDCIVANKVFSYTFYLGDKIRFTQNIKQKTVQNGDYAIIVEFIKKGNKNNIKVKMSDGTLRIISQDLYTNKNGHWFFILGYGISVFSSQGLTVKNNTYVYYSKFMDRSNTYVACSRHREKCYIFVNQEDTDGKIKNKPNITANERINVLAQYMKIDRYEKMTLEYLDKI